jgi:hypothetical protein
MIRINGVPIVSRDSIEAMDRIERIKTVHAANPDYTRKQLIAFVPETKYMVDKYLSGHKS